MAINTAQIRDLLFPGLAGVEGKYQQIATQWSTVYDSAPSKMNIERRADMRYLGLAQIKSEGGPTPFDNAAGERWVWNQEHIEIGLGYAITRKTIDDNLYKAQFNPSNLGLMESFAQFKEIQAAAVLNSGDTYNANVGGDGKALFATDHPVDGGTFANRPTTDLSLNEGAIQSQLILTRQFVDQANLKIFARGKKLIVPIQLEYVAERLTKTELRPGTANNDVNATITAGGIPEGYQVMDYLTSSYAWFIKSNKKGLQYYDRVPFETDMQVDPNTGNLLVMGYARYSFNYYDPRAAVGSYPTA